MLAISHELAGNYMISLQNCLDPLQGVELSCIINSDKLCEVFVGMDQAYKATTDMECLQYVAIQIPPLK